MIGIGLAINQGNSGGIEAAIRALFANGEQGAWYDPSDFSTLYQDSQGVTPVTAVEQPVGLMFDKRFGIELGTELVSDPGMNNPAAWVVPSEWSIAGGVATKTAGTAQELYSTIGIVTGGTYRITFDIVANAGFIVPRLSGGTISTSSSVTVSGSYSVVITANDNTRIGFSAGATFAGTVDNVSVKRISTGNGNHARQATAASRPVLSARVNLLQWSEDFSNESVWNRVTAGTGTIIATTPNYGVAPDGTTTACRFNGSLNGGTTSSDFIRLRQNITHTASLQYVSSVYLKSNDANTYNAQLVAASGSGQAITITPTWQRFETTPGAGFEGNVQFGILLRGAQTPTHSNSIDILVWHPQDEISSTTASRYQRTGPLRNLFTYTEDFSNAIWAKNASTVSNNVLTSNGGGETSLRYTIPTHSVGQAQVLTVRASPGNGGMLVLRLISVDSSTLTGLVQFDLSTGTIVHTGSTYTDKCSITPIGNGGFSCSIWGIGAASPAAYRADICISTTVGGLTCTAGATLTLLGAQYEYNTAPTAYERVDTAATTYDTVGFPHYLKFDGVDDGMATAAIDFSAIDKMSVSAGVRKLSDTAYGAIAELSDAPDITNGSFGIGASTTAGDGASRRTYAFIGRGTAPTGFGAATYAAPISNVLSVKYDIAGAATASEIFPRIDGVVPPLTVTAGTDLGTGNFASNPLYIGRRGNAATVPFNGHLYGLIVRGTTSTDSQVRATEQYLASKSGVTIV